MPFLSNEPLVFQVAKDPHLFKYGDFGSTLHPRAVITIITDDKRCKCEDFGAQNYGNTFHTLTVISDIIADM